MGPMGFLTGVVLGSAASIALVLAMVVVIFAVNAGAGGAVRTEYPALLAGAGLFALLAVASAAAFLGLLRRSRWRWLAQAAMWLVFAGVAWHYWPETRG